MSELRLTLLSEVLQLSRVGMRPGTTTLVSRAIDAVVDIAVAIVGVGDRNSRYWRGKIADYGHEMAALIVLPADARPQWRISLEFCLDL